MKDLFDLWFLENRKRIVDNLINFLSINTVSPKEELAFPWIEDYLSQVDFSVKKQFLHSDLSKHKSFRQHPLSIVNDNRFNIKVNDKKNCSKNKKKVLFNIHIDVVPATNNFPEAFTPVVKDNFVYGRGACDTKSNLIMLTEAIRFMNENNIEIQKEVEIDLVVEEEISGSGTLSSIMHGINADLVIVMEPTNLLLYRGHRGCITATIDINGKSVHMGSNDTGVNAIECAYHVINKLKELESKLIEEAKRDKDFAIWNKPLQVNIGKIVGGEWPGSVAEKCQVKSNVGFLPNYSLKQMESIISEVCTSTGDDWTNQNTIVTFNELKNNAYIVSETDANVKELINILDRYGINSLNTYGWKVSCDAHLYYTLLGIPTLIFGCGSLDDAHSAHERVEINELALGILVLVDYLSKP